MKTSVSVLSMLCVGFVVAILPRQAIGQSTEELFDYEVDLSAFPRQQAIYHSLSDLPFGKRIKAVSLPHSSLVERPYILANLNDTAPAMIVRSHGAHLDDGSYEWWGYITSGKNATGNAFFYISNEGQVSGRITQHRGPDFVIESIGNGINALIEIDHSKLPDDHSSSAFPVELSKMSSELETQTFAESTENRKVRILVAYTPDAEARVAMWGSTITSKIGAFISSNNGTWSRSDVEGSLELAYKHKVNYDEVPGYAHVALTHLRSSTDLYMNEIHSLRTQYRADMVVLLGDFVYNPCGIAVKTGGNPSEQFAVVDVSCANVNYSFEHEIAHLIGCSHNEEDLESFVNPTYSMGHWKDVWTGTVAPFRTVMSTNYPCGTCERIAYFSNPDVLLYSDKVGAGAWPTTPTGTQTANNARKLNERIPYVAAYYPDPLTPKRGVVPTEEDVSVVRPGVIELSSFPNPFYSNTVISYTLDADAPVELKIYDIRAREVAILTDRIVKSGRYNVRFDAAGLPSGTYVVRLIVDGKSFVRIITLNR